MVEHPNQHFLLTGNHHFTRFCKLPSNTLPHRRHSRTHLSLASRESQSQIQENEIPILRRQDHRSLRRALQQHRKRTRPQERHTRQAHTAMD